MVSVPVNLLPDRIPLGPPSLHQIKKKAGLHSPRGPCQLSPASFLCFPPGAHRAFQSPLSADARTSRKSIQNTGLVTGPHQGFPWGKWFAASCALSAEAKAHWQQGWPSQPTPRQCWVGRTCTGQAREAFTTRIEGHEERGLQRGSEASVADERLKTPPKLEWCIHYRTRAWEKPTALFTFRDIINRETPNKNKG